MSKMKDTLGLDPIKAAKKLNEDRVLVFKMGLGLVALLFYITMPKSLVVLAVIVVMAYRGAKRRGTLEKQVKSLQADLANAQKGATVAQSGASWTPTVVKH